MKKLSCKDVNPNTDCHFEATGESSAEVAGKMFGHVRAQHADDVKDMDDTALRAMLESKVHE
jgi:predicted small metal-binding protein